MMQPHKTQGGFAIIAAIFLLVVLAALGAFMVTFSNTQHLTSAQDVQGSRAYWVARTGLEWGIAGITTTCPTSPTTLSINSFSVLVTCGLQTYPDLEVGVTIRIYRITSVASTGTIGSLGFIERSLSATIEK
jgi:MSHA biogenesis protein MshP